MANPQSRSLIGCRVAISPSAYRQASGPLSPSLASGTLGRPWPSVHIGYCSEVRHKNIRWAFLLEAAIFKETCTLKTAPALANERASDC
ncbi:hypothetical protein [Desulfosporosinus acidiphilus]|uniref:hypothetical protein n=1 Tax=Desulfosporosinus acidiphilus TaxID=885581 RepID=UPI0011D21C10|nr:hypothetical protein [Desulfosporosinus acidiphilus]